jgi:hypothetical protein
LPRSRRLRVGRGLRARTTAGRLRLAGAPQGRRRCVRGRPRLTRPANFKLELNVGSLQQMPSRCGQLRSTEMSSEVRMLKGERGSKTLRTRPHTAFASLRGEPSENGASVNSDPHQQPSDASFMDSGAFEGSNRRPATALSWRTRPAEAANFHGRWTLFTHPTQIDHGKLPSSPLSRKAKRTKKISAVYSNMWVCVNRFAFLNDDRQLNESCVYSLPVTQYSDGKYRIIPPPQRITGGGQTSSTSYDYIRSASKRLGLQPQNLHGPAQIRFERFGEFLTALHHRLETEAAQ